ncbi:MAG: hypothetical protein ACREEW_02220, partial [Caulobacteraceae bacterium]
PAEIWGLKDRGRLIKGYAADDTVYDAAATGRGEERPVFDMPGEGMRYVRDSVGVGAVVVAGEVAWESGRYTGSKSGAVCALN